MKKGFYTVHILSDKREKPMVLSFSAAALRALLITAAILLVIFLGALYYYLPRALNYNVMVEENQQLVQDRLKVTRILSDYNQIRQMDRYIRSVLGPDLSLPNIDSLSFDSLFIPPGSNWQTGVEEIEISYLDNIPIYPPVDGYITQGFTNDRIFTDENHYGVDVAAPEGEPIKASASGVVVFSNWTYDLGYTLILYHSNGYFTIYGHNLRNIAEEHQYVNRGEVIGYVGNTGVSNGPHLHFEIWREGSPIDPQAMIFSYRRLDVSVDNTGG